MRKLNVKFLLCLVAGLAAFGASAALAHHLQVRRIPQALLKQAQRAEDDNDPARASNYLSRYLDFVPDDAEQRVRLARLLAGDKLLTGRKAVVNALLALEKALSYDANRHDLRRLAVPLAIRLGRLE